MLLFTIKLLGKRNEPIHSKAIITEKATKGIFINFNAIKFFQK